MFAETGIPVLLGLFCEVNSSVLLSVYGTASVHGLTAYWDQARALTGRGRPDFGVRSSAAIRCRFGPASARWPP